ncbi:MAG: hypothetical protein IKE38_04735 [Erysipelotrichaceae bacterium]|nr:hypothetical protein [Erysipelotrichaceae bacterium]
MKKLLIVLFALLLVLSLGGCKKKGTDDNTDNKGTVTAANNYADFVAAGNDDELEILMSVQNHQSWWDNKLTIYAQDDDGGYFLYEAKVDEETAKKLEPGTLIKVKGYKGEWASEVELLDATVEIVEGAGKVYDAKDISDIADDDLKMKEYINQKIAIKGLLVVEVNKKDSDSDPDLYITVLAKDNLLYDLCVENYLNGPETIVYQTAAKLQPGDTIDIEGFMYWYEGPNPHVTAVTVE